MPDPQLVILDTVKGESLDVQLNGSVGTSFNRVLKLIIYLCMCTWCTRVNQSHFYFKEIFQIQHYRQPIRKWFRITRLSTTMGYVFELIYASPRLQPAFRRQRILFFSRLFKHRTLDSIEPYSSSRNPYLEPGMITN